MAEIVPPPCHRRLELTIGGVVGRWIVGQRASRAVGRCLRGTSPARRNGAASLRRTTRPEATRLDGVATPCRRPTQIPADRSRIASMNRRNQRSMDPRLRPVSVADVRRREHGPQRRGRDVRDRCRCPTGPRRRRRTVSTYATAWSRWRPDRSRARRSRRRRTPSPSVSHERRARTPRSGRRPRPSTVVAAPSTSSWARDRGATCGLARLVRSSWLRSRYCGSRRQVLARGRRPTSPAGLISVPESSVMCWIVFENSIWSRRGRSKPCSAFIT